MEISIVQKHRRFQGGFDLIGNIADEATSAALDIRAVDNNLFW